MTEDQPLTDCEIAGIVAHGGSRAMLERLAGAPLRTAVLTAPAATLDWARAHMTTRQFERLTFGFPAHALALARDALPIRTLRILARLAPATARRVVPDLARDPQVRDNLADPAPKRFGTMTEPTTITEVADRIRAVMRATGLSDDGVAKALGLSPKFVVQTWRIWAREERHPSRAVMSRVSSIARELQIEDLL